jgi:superfamily II DNA or RNA helicase
MIVDDDSASHMSSPSSPPATEPVTTPSGDRYYQVDAVNAAHEGYKAGDRGQLHMACGTGKTRVYMRIAARECSGGLVVVLAPSVWLLGQIIREWRTGFGLDHVAMAVCHDTTVAEDPEGYGIHHVPVTTSEFEVATWLARKHAAGAARLVVATHRSVKVVGRALRHAGLAADLVVVDESHHSAGRVDKVLTVVHDNALFPAVRRLYATATPVQPVDSRGGPARPGALGMDNETLFGPVFSSYPLARGIADTYLDDYRIVVVGVSDNEARRLLQRRRATPAGAGSPIDLHTAMCQIVLAKTAALFDLRRIITFHRTVAEAVTFAQTLPDTVAAMTGDRPDRPLTSLFVHGEMKIRERERILDMLREPPGEGWTSVANMRCLGEGVDVPAVDGILFAYAKGSETDIIQAVGRATRRNPAGSGISTIILPISVPDTPGTDIDPDTLTAGRFQVLWNVLRALRQHDSTFARDLDLISTGHRSHREGRPPGSGIELHLPRGWSSSSSSRSGSCPQSAARGGTAWTPCAVSTPSTGTPTSPQAPSSTGWTCSTGARPTAPPTGRPGCPPTATPRSANSRLTRTATPCGGPRRSTPCARSGSSMATSKPRGAWSSTGCTSGLGRTTSVTSTPRALCRSCGGPGWNRPGCAGAAGPAHLPSISTPSPPTGSATATSPSRPTRPPTTVTSGSGSWNSVSWHARTPSTTTSGDG